METQTLTEADSLAAELVGEFASPQSRLFYLKAINRLGAGLVREAAGEVRMRDLGGGLSDKAAYLTRVLVQWMKERGVYEGSLEREPDEPDLSGSPFSIIDASRTATPAVQNDEIRTLDFPFSPDLIQWLVFVGPEYFTLTNEKARADRVESTKVDWKGKSYEVPMLRGRLGRNDAERGILTSEHMRILGAVERIWSRHTGPHERLGRRCIVRTTVPEIAEHLGINPGGREYKRIAEKVQDLASTGYTYLLRENAELHALGLEDVNFKFFAEAQAITTNTNGKKTTYFEIAFSRVFSSALLARDRNLVSRPPDMLQIRGDIALKMYVYLYRILAAKKEHSIELKNLIKALDLRLAGWHQYKSQRKREFEKAIREINGRQTHDKERFVLTIDQGLNKADFVLIARLEKSY